MKHIICCLVVALGIFPAGAATWKIHYAREDVSADLRTLYPISVLSLALNHTGVRYELIPTAKPMAQGKAIKQLKANREVSLVWSMTDKTREEELLPVRIPIYKGLIGWRIFLVNRENQDIFDRFETLEELRQFQPVQGYDWPDTKILQSNGFEVVTTTDYVEMFTLLRSERANFFPRSVVEIWAELERRDLSDGMVVEPHLAVRYPTATYFFFNKKNVVLANLVETGLRRAIESGEFDRLFFQIHQEYLELSKIDSRLVFELTNPELPDATPISDSSLWYDIDRTSKSEVN